MPDPGLLAELEAADCPCGKSTEECEEDGGCRYTREIAAVASARDEEIRVLTKALRAELGRHSPLDTGWGKVCSYCWTRGGSRALWPCPPAMDLAGAFSHTEGTEVPGD